MKAMQSVICSVVALISSDYRSHKNGHWYHRHWPGITSIGTTRMDTPGRGGPLRFGLVEDVPPAAQNPYSCSGVMFPKKGDHVQGCLHKQKPIFSNFIKIFQYEPQKIVKIRSIGIFSPP